MIYTSIKQLSHLTSIKMDNNPVLLWDNKATASNVSAPNGAVALFPASNMVTGSTNDRCQPTVSSGEYIVETTEALLANAIGIDSHNIGTVGGSIYLEFSDDGAAWVDSGFGEKTPANDGAIYYRFRPVTKYYRLRIVAAEQVAIGSLMIGEETIIEQRVYQNIDPPLRPNNVEADGQVSEGGEIVGSRMVTRGSVFILPFEHVRDTTLRSAEWLSFIDHYNEKRPFFIAWRPRRYPADIWVAQNAGKAFKATNSGPKARMSFTLELRLRHE